MDLVWFTESVGELGRSIKNNYRDTICHDMEL